MLHLIHWAVDAIQAANNEQGDNNNGLDKEIKEAAEKEYTCSSSLTSSLIEQWGEEVCILPDLVVLRVLHYVSLDCLLQGNVRLVCRQWHRLCVEYGTTQVRSLNLLVGPSPRIEQIFANVLRLAQLPMTKTLVLASPATKAKRLLRLSARTKALTTLTLYQRDQCISAQWLCSMAIALSPVSPWHSSLARLHLMLRDRNTLNCTSLLQTPLIELLKSIGTMPALRHLIMDINFDLSADAISALATAITSGIDTCAFGSLDYDDRVVHALAKHYDQLRQDHNSTSDDSQFHKLHKLTLINSLEEGDTVRRIGEQPVLASIVAMLKLSKQATVQLATAWPALLTASHLSGFSSLTKLNLEVNGDQCLRGLSGHLSRLPALDTVEIAFDLTSYVLDDEDGDSPWVSAPNVLCLRLFVTNLDPVTGLAHAIPAARALGTVFTGVRKCELYCEQCVPCGYDGYQCFLLPTPSAHFATAFNRCHSRLMYALSSTLPMVTAQVW